MPVQASYGIKYMKRLSQVSFHMALTESPIPFISCYGTSVSMLCLFIERTTFVYSSIYCFLRCSCYTTGAFKKKNNTHAIKVKPNIVVT